jgi:hypothetical protein
MSKMMIFRHFIVRWVDEVQLSNHCALDLTIKHQD